MKTTKVVNPKTIKREWFLVDATDAVLGRLASRVAKILIGSHKVQYSPNQDHGDHVIVINADKIRLTGKKASTKEYFLRSRRPGHSSLRPFKKQLSIDSTKIIMHAVHGMVPKKALGRIILRKLHVYKDASHPHIAQKPKTLLLHK